MESRQSPSQKTTTREDSDLFARFSAEEAESSLLAPARRILLACSGGADSVALLRLVVDWASNRGEIAPELFVGHVHHGMRGAEADRDASFVEELSSRLGLPFLVHRVATGRAPRSEGEARELRYAVFGEWAETERVDIVALAHHREDQQEGILLRICRGAGIAGLAGMPVRRRLGGAREGVSVVRPLLSFSRQELREYLESISQPFRHDELNDELSIPRNRVRHEVLPQLEEHVHPGVRASLERLGEHARQVDDDLAFLAGRALDEALVQSNSERVVLDVGVLGSWTRSVRRSLFRELESRLCGGGLTRLDAKRFAAIEDLLARQSARERGAVRVDLGDGLTATREAGTLELAVRGDLFSRGRSGPVVERESREIAIDGAAATWGTWTIAASRHKEARVTEDRWVEWVDADALCGTLEVRARRPGDRLQPLGAPGTKKLKEFLRERGVDPLERDQVPVVAIGDEIVWVVGERLAHPFRVRESTRRYVRLAAQRLPRE